MDAPPTPATDDAASAGLDLAAAVDLGSNSFHMLVARVAGDRIVVVDRLKERVRLGAGLDAQGRLTAEAQDRALACLLRFGQRLRDMPPGSVRALGTNTLRQAKNRGDFLQRAAEVLGHPIEVVSGREEARLVYLGVAHSVSDPVFGSRRLVVDIGGGSTEVIIGEHMRPLAAESMYMGCVSFSLRHFPDGVLTEKRFDEAFIAARLEMEPHKKLFRSLSWERALGSSGTIVAIADLLRAQGLGSTITDRGLRRLRRAMVAAGRIDQLSLPGLAPERAQVLPGGLAILQGVMRSLHLERLEAASGTIREGALVDLLGRRRHQDARDATVDDLARRWGLDLLQAARVERTARALWEAVAGAWGLQDPALGMALSWAARLHELGLAIAHPGYHKHGAYIVANADLPGFSRQDQELLSALVRSHRRKLRPDVFQALPRPLQARALRLAVLLRVAVRLHRSRSDRPLPLLRAAVAKKRPRQLRLLVQEGWLAEHPLTAADLERERGYMAAVGLELSLGDLPAARFEGALSDRSG
ncbi:Ppx/GppA family phosphatase [Myxococcota bacterium]|nr:Ppx/GppA family phosphatase [Myxococcota bacterium]